MTGSVRRHRVAVLAVPPIHPFDLSIPELVFGAAAVDGELAYEVQVCAAEPGVLSSMTSLEVSVRHSLDIIVAADTLLVTGTGARTNADPIVLQAIRDAHAAGIRVASICSGAFLLAQAGILDGRAATTYWTLSDEFATSYPQVDLRPDVLFVESGDVLTSAGLAAGIDLCLHLVRQDHGAKVANAVARLAVVAPVRTGGQAQFIESPLPAENGTSLAETRAWALENLTRPVTLAQLGERASISVRTLTRRFRAETGSSPLQWLLLQRLDRARELLEGSDLSMDAVADRCGLGSADSLRQHFKRRYGVAPSTYRTTFSTVPAA